MEERGLRVLQADTTFFNKVSNTLSKFFSFTKPPLQVCNSPIIYNTFFEL